MGTSVIAQNKKKECERQLCTITHKTTAYELSGNSKNEMTQHQTIPAYTHVCVYVCMCVCVCVNYFLFFCFVMMVGESIRVCTRGRDKGDNVHRLLCRGFYFESFQRPITHDKELSPSSEALN
uniref:Uncharacterized protein n=1 Tax=Trypanosoma vivax (strain Y486) TaxID=1055687 RepID=G0TUQ2_TRYVY|nr:hypothetical protein, unlikely [Trypanosoma vivax Y486]